MREITLLEYFIYRFPRSRGWALIYYTGKASLPGRLQLQSHDNVRVFSCRPHLPSLVPLVVRSVETGAVRSFGLLDCSEALTTAQSIIFNPTLSAMERQCGLLGLSLKLGMDVGSLLALVGPPEQTAGLVQALKGLVRTPSSLQQEAELKTEQPSVFEEGKFETSVRQTSQEAK